MSLLHVQVKDVGNHVTALTLYRDFCFKAILPPGQHKYPHKGALGLKLRGKRLLQLPSSYYQP